MMTHTQQNIKHMFCSFTYNFVCIDNRFSKIVVLYGEKNAFIGSLKQFLKIMIIAKKL